MTTTNRDNVLWLDFETTGLMNDPDTVTLEAAAIISDGGLSELATFDSRVIDAEENFVRAMSTMSDFIRRMHGDTGLLDRIAAGQSQPLVDVDQALK